MRVPIYPLVHLGTAEQAIPWIADLVSADIDAAGAANTFLLGDSAGGQIALYAAILLRNSQFDQPGRVFLVAPVLDSAVGNPAIDAVESTDPWFSRRYRKGAPRADETSTRSARPVGKPVRR